MPVAASVKASEPACISLDLSCMATELFENASRAVEAVAPLHTEPSVELSASLIPLDLAFSSRET